jgi:quinol monooxygenase YgiN
MSIKWLVPLGQTRALTMALHSVAEATRGTHGCVGCSVTTDIGNRGEVHYTEEWITEADLRERLRSHTFDSLCTLIDDATPAPRIEFTLAHETRGFDFVEEVRASAR